MEQTAQIPPAATPEAQPIETASQTAAQSLPRSASGRFTGQGAVALDAPAPVSDYLAVEEGTAQLERLVKQAIAELARPARARRGKRAKQRVWALAASPGASKSRTSQSEIAAQPRNKFRGDILWHALTLKLAEEGAEHVRQLGKPVQVMRGRSAPLFPGSTERMCRKWQLAERLGRMGYNITNSLCRRVDQSGEEHLCPHYARCAYWRNMRDLTAAPQIRFAATSYLPLGKDADRPVGLRIVDETLWAGLLWHSDLRMDTFLTRRQPLAKDQKSKQLALKVTKAARAVVDALKSERRDPMQLPSTKKDYQAFARFEEAHIDELPEIRPEISEADQLAIVELAESRSRDARRMARLWRLLAAAKKAGRKRVERVRLILDHRDSREVSARHVIRLLGCKAPPRDAPVLLLDADADLLITEAIFPGATISEIRL